MPVVFTTPDGLKYKAAVIPPGSMLDRTATACSLCEVRQCNINQCQEWRELSTLSLSCIPRTYFKLVEL